ncbi:DNA-binding protein [Prosthecochloris sp. SCSIO W1101]|uniref:PPC domain-containing DNA-binding protein n=1 Tax=Prosthecochloris sp. SCSIO W1101 TaxID=2992242 RepID=UPI00223D27A0|nr:PPC domain-containing DNA-binding protein [Prosthecochloris sp. SCSIO W1101]UZJ42359.1 DNA-binding protein [Prosthecochloris sp. SCSIO W1101]
MSRIHKVASRSLHMGKLKRGDDLLGAISVICRENNIRLGRVEAIGAVEKATLGYYDQTRKEYDFFTIDTPHEITSLIGNVSLRDGVPMVHAHLTLSDEKGNVKGGHLAPGTIVFACETVIEAFEGLDFNRIIDEDTGLPLWQL